MSKKLKAQTGLQVNLRIGNVRERQTMQRLADAFAVAHPEHPQNWSEVIRWMAGLAAQHLVDADRLKAFGEQITEVEGILRSLAEENAWLRLHCDVPDDMTAEDFINTEAMRDRIEEAAEEAGEEVAEEFGELLFGEFELN